jgi:DNA-binding NarL/FixJ family response regulator
MNPTEQKPITVLICDDQDVVRQGLNIILTYSDGIEVVGTASNGEEGVKMALQLNPNVVLMDLQMPELNGVQATRRLTNVQPDTKVLVLTTFDGDDWVFNAIRAGASGYLLKDTDGEEIAQAVRDVAGGKVVLDGGIAGKILTEFNRLDTTPNPKTNPNDPILESLTERELSILSLMAEGKTNQEIAAALFLATGTVKNNVSNIIGKLHSNDRTQAVLTALRRGIVSL